MNTIYGLFKYGAERPEEQSEHYGELAKTRDEKNSNLKKNEKPYYVTYWLFRPEVKYLLK